MIGQMNSIRIYHPLFLFYFSSPSYPIRFFFAPIEGENERTRYGAGTDRVRRKYEESKIVLFVGVFIQPFQSAAVRKMFYFEMFKSHIKPCPIRAGSH